MSESRASSEPLTSPSPSPPPAGPSKKPAAKTAGLDSSSELSELTEDEQDGSRDSTHSSTPQALSKREVSRKKRGGIVPAPMWGWAYKAANKKTPDDEVGARPLQGEGARAEDDDDEEEEEDEEGEEEADGPSKPKIAPARAGTGEADEGGGAPAEHESEEEEDEEDEDEEEDDDDDENPPGISLLKVDIRDREGSTELTEVDDAEDSPSPSDAQEPESEAELEPHADSDGDSDIDADGPEEEEPANADDEDGEDEDGEVPATNADTAPVVPLAPAGSSIMAGQQLIKTPSPSPSTSPEPEDDLGAEVDPNPEAGEPGVDAEADNDADLPEHPDNADADIEADADVEGDVDADIEAEEAELDLQPAHRAEALDVLAQIELRFALLREALYVEKMEDLAMEEAMVLQNLHPEMVHLQTELQVRHDRRLELAAKKRKYEDEHVLRMRKAEEEAVWSWWKFERDVLQTDMFSEANGKRRKLEREKRLLDRPMPVRGVLPAPAVRVPSRPLSVRDLIKFASVDSALQNSSKPRRKEPISQAFAYPKLSVLSTQEIQSDLQLLAAPRMRPGALYGPMGGGEIGPGMGLGLPQQPPMADGQYAEYRAPPVMGINSAFGPPQHVPFGHDNSLSAPQANTHQHHGYAPSSHPHPTGRSVYNHQPLAPAPAPPPPMGSIHPGRMQGPGAPPPPGTNLGSYLGHGTRPMRRSPSPPLPAAGHGPEHGGMVNGGPGTPYNHSGSGGTTGPGQPWTPVPQGANLSAGGVPGPSKQPVVNGWGKEHGHGRRVQGSSKDGLAYDVRDREIKQEREMRERDRLWQENGTKDSQDDYAGGRMHAPPLQQSQYPHRHTSLHQSLQGVPHHHHVVHRHGTHHHHSTPRSGVASTSQHNGTRSADMDRHLSIPEHEHNARRGSYGQGHEQMNHVSKPLKSSNSPMWKPEELEPSLLRDRDRERERDRDRDRDRDRGRQALLAPAPSGMPVQTDRDRPQVTPFVMTPSQATQLFPRGGGSPSRREPWIDEAPHGRAPYESSASGVDVGPRHSAQSHHHLSSPSRQPSSHNLGSPRMRTLPSSPPLSALPNHLHSPSRMPPLGSVHASPLASSSTPKNSRPISPLPTKLIPSSYPPSGPGTPGTGSRLGTPGLSGPGTRPDGPPNGHAHGPVNLFPSLAGPGQPLLSSVVSEVSHLAPPPKMGVVQLGNGS